MTVMNGSGLLTMAPIEDMERSKKVGPGGTSYGLSEAGYDIRIKQDVIMHPFRRFVLASTIERFDMPYSLIAEIADKSTWVRRKVTVQNTKAEPGWRGYLTLELIYHGWGIIKIPAGAGIAQVLFHVLHEPADYGAGKYQDQEDQPVPARWSAGQGGEL